VEWVQTTGKTVEEAKERALDELGVDHRDAEFDVLEEPRSGLFGLTRGEARVRARVRPTAPRPKPERRRRAGSRSGGTGSRGGGGNGGGRGGGGNGSGRQKATNGQQQKSPQGRSASRRGGGRGGQQRGGQDRPPKDDRTQDNGENTTMSEASTEEQAQSAEAFLSGLVEAFGLDATVSSEEHEDDVLEVSIDGEDLGLLIGPKGRTLWALQELTKTVVQRQQGGGLSTRIRVDVAGYRERRKAALERFSRDAAAAVLESGVARALEPMGAADRKVVHDTVNDIDGVTTRSEGEDPRRRVVIAPAEGD